MGHPEDSLAELGQNLRAQPSSLPEIPGYEILEKLGQGGMGIVFRARQTSLNRIVAIKVILSGQLAQEEDIRRFAEEAKIAAQLQHPNIVTVHEFGQTPQGQYYFTMEYVSGKPLSEAIRTQEIDLPRALAITSEIAFALTYAHGQQVIHRDIKPANIFLDSYGKPKLMDFGLAKVISGGKHTLSGAVLGTPQYMSPEQAEGKIKEIGPRSDLYSLGAVLYEMIAGRPPFQGDSIPRLLYQVTYDPPSAPSQFVPSIPQEIDQLCLRALEKKPQRRYSSAAEFREHLEQCLQKMRETESKPAEKLPQTGKTTRRGQKLRNIEKSPSQRTIAPKSRTRPIPHVASKPSSKIVLLLLLLLFSAVGGGIFWSKKSPSSPTTSEEKMTGHPPQISAEGTSQESPPVSSKEGNGSPSPPAHKEPQTNTALSFLGEGKPQEAQNNTSPAVAPATNNRGEPHDSREKAVPPVPARQSTDWRSHLAQTCGLTEQEIEKITYRHQGRPILDMASEFWGKFPHDAQARYATEYQKGYATESGNCLEKKVIFSPGEFVFVLVPPGRFRMGSSANEKGHEADEQPQHVVVISDPFWLGKWEITQAQWVEVAGTKPWLGQENASENAQQAASSMSWEDVHKTFLARGEGDILRLPTEAQWEYAYRSGTTTRFSWGDDPEEKDIEQFAWYKGNPVEKRPQHAMSVGQKNPNGWGLYDMAGNVSEWCMDGKGRYAGQEEINPLRIGMGKERVYRGGAWSLSAKCCRAGNRRGDSPDRQRAFIGFRLAAPLDLPAAIALKEESPAPSPKPKRQEAPGREIPMFRANFQHTGVFTATGVPQLIGLKWKTLGPCSTSSPVVADGSLYCANLQFGFQCLDAETGKEKWKFRTGVVRSTPVIDNGAVYFGCDDGYLYALSTSGGKEIWKAKIEGQCNISSPVVENGIVYIGTAGGLYAVNSRDGQIKWKYTPQSGVFSSPAIAKGVVYFGSLDTHLYAITQDRGQYLWKFKTQRAIYASPSLANGVVYGGSFDHCFYAISQESGKEKWRTGRKNGAIESSAAIAGGKVYFGTEGGHFYALDQETGKEKWMVATGGQVLSSPAIAKGVVYFGSLDQHFYALDQETGQEKWKYRADSGVRTSPWIGEGTVYFGTDGYVYALK